MAIDENGFGAGAAFIDGVYVPIAEAKIPILDWGFLRSDATCDAGECGGETAKGSGIALPHRWPRPSPSTTDRMWQCKT